MKIDEQIKGFILEEDKEYPFIYEDNYLLLFPTSRDEWNQQRINSRKDFINNVNEEKVKENKWIESKRLHGITNKNNSIIFEVSSNSFSDNGFIGYSVNFILVYDNSKVTINQINGFTTSGRELDVFYNPSRAFSTEFHFNETDSKVASIVVNGNSTDYIGEYQKQGIDIEINLSIIPKYKFNQGEPLSAKTNISFAFSKECNIDFLLDVYMHLKKFFYYVCGRTNIEFYDLHIHGSGYKNVGVLRFVEDNNNNESNVDNIIKYELLNSNTIELFKCVSKKEMYFEHLCNSYEERQIYSIARIIHNFVAFEREYRNIYGEKSIRSDAYFEVKKDVLESLGLIKEKLSGRKKDYIKSFMRTIEKSDNKLSSKIENAIKDCKDILLSFVEHYYGEYSKEKIKEISERMNELRNDLTHGNIDIEIEPIHLNDFAIMECLTYAMRLKKIGLEPDNIQECIRSIRGQKY